jgi:DNA invertase Pin-like site-specific DNA recombinase
MLIGYARTSTLEQIAGYEAQHRELQAAGCERLYSEQVSSVATRIKLDAALADLRKGDTLVVTKLDRLARSMRDLMNIVEAVKTKGATLRILAMNLDTGTPTGTLMLNMLGSVAQFEREMMLERQKEGIAKAKTDGKYKGRAPTAMRKSDQVKALAASGIGATDIAKQLNIGRASVYRALGPTLVKA